MLRLSAALPFFMLVSAGSVARAAPAVGSPMAWETSVDPACRVRPAQFAREVDLACDAVGKSCRRVDRGGALRAVLACRDGAPWTVEARDANGAHLWTIAIEGARESRVRVAAMWIARAPRDAPPPDAKVIAAPLAEAPAPLQTLPTPPAPSPKPDAQKAAAPKPDAAKAEASSKGETQVAPSQKNVLPQKEAAKEASNPPSAVAPTSAPEKAAQTEKAGPAEKDAPNDAAPTRARGGLAASIGAAASSGIATPAIDVGARVAFALPYRFNVGLALGGSRSVGSATSYSLTAGRVGAALGWGAPWTDGIFGVAIDAGALAGSVGTTSSASPGARGFAVPYGVFAIIAAVPTRRAFRPWVSVSLLALTRAIQVTENGQPVASSAQASAGIDVGVTWAAW